MLCGMPALLPEKKILFGVMCGFQLDVPSPRGGEYFCELAKTIRFETQTLVGTVASSHNKLNFCLTIRLIFCNYLISR